MTITVAQLKAARQLLDWSQDDVASASGLETITIVNFEHGKAATESRGRLRYSIGPRSRWRRVRQHSRRTRRETEEGALVD
jgi:hypothetical protein